MTCYCLRRKKTRTSSADMQNYYVTPHSLGMSSQPSHPLFTLCHIKSASLLFSECPQVFSAVMGFVLPVPSPFCRSNCHPSALSLKHVSAKVRYRTIPAQDVTARTVLTFDRVCLGSDFTVSIWPIHLFPFMTHSRMQVWCRKKLFSVYYHTLKV